ncbi:MAG TPA: SIR2 family protein [Chitinophagaceae bacterium]|jgi:hypothetical protein|nr:SIR2 family protein [Chitinophagaceae bacterium]
MDTLTVESQTDDSLLWNNADDNFWDELTYHVYKKNCVLFLGPSLPLYSTGAEKYDFYSLASLHLSRLMENYSEYDPLQAQNLYYTAQKFIAFKKKYRNRLEDEIATLYKEEKTKLKAETPEGIPSLYKSILAMPWNTIVNTQPDNFFENVLKPNEVFSFYHYKNKDVGLQVDKRQFLVYNLFGVIHADNEDYNVDSLVLTEEDHVDFVRNLVTGNPRVPESVISRLDNEKTYLFLDCNLENWYFRLLMETLKIHKESHTFLSRHKRIKFPAPTMEFYKNRYGFVFISDNSEEFINKLWKEYQKRYPPPPPPKTKKLFIAYHDADEELVQSLIYQFTPWVENKSLTIWSKKNMEGGDPIIKELEEFNSADGILLLISAPFLNEPFLSRYLKPAIDKVFTAQNPKKVFAVLKSACPWQETAISRLNQKYILPDDQIPIRLQQTQDPDKILYEIASCIKKNLCE